MLVKNIFRATICAPLFGFSLAASAGLMLETYASGAATLSNLGGYDMTDIDSTFSSKDCPENVECLASSIQLSTGLIEFRAKSGTELEMVRGTANLTDWWVNGEKRDYDIYTTHVNWVELILPTNTRALSFNVGADFNGRGWLEAFTTNGQGNLEKHYFDVNRKNTPGFGIFADNQNNECGSISSIIIDPSHWGFGNLSINQSECTASVPEPGVMSLLGIGLLGLGLARTKYAV